MSRPKLPHIRARRSAFSWLTDKRANGEPLDRAYAGAIIKTLAWFEGELADRDAWKAAFGVEPLRDPEVAAEYVKALVEEASEADALKAALEPEKLARLFHEAYERLAPDFGYETRPESAVPWEDVPQPNKRLMEAVAAEVCGALLADTEGGGEA